MYGRSYFENQLKMDELKKKEADDLYIENINNLKHITDRFKIELK